MEIGRFALALVGHFLASLLYVLQRLHLVEAVVDTSSILEHREELRELWEKRMMADENQSSSSSTVTETNDSTKPHQEEDAEEKTVEKSESESAKHHKMSNGIAKHSADVPDGNANHIHDRAEIAKEEPVVLHSTVTDADQENNNSADSLEEDNVEDYVEQKTYTSNLEQALVMTETKVSSSSETQVASNVTTITTTTTTKVEEEMHETSEETVQMETQELVTTANKEEEHHTEQVATTVAEDKTEEESTTTVVEDHRQETTSEVVVDEKATAPEKETAPEADAIAHQEESLTPTPAEESVIQDHHKKVESMSEKIVIPDVEGDGEDDGFVRVEECLPKDDSADEILDMPEEHDEQSHEERDIPSSNGFEEQSLPVSPISSTASDKMSPEMEQFVKSGGVKRIIPGVQKTEQPYNTCTTETKIAMEIREMREREEELRLMREQALLSPVVSPVPPKTPTSVRTPSPSPKEGPSPVPQSGPGYRVSSVFGHRGISPSPSVEEEKKTYKTFSKESAVEKEIRLAKDREEELRKQKGLPPREDDSYVKPSQVKSSQVRVFGKMAGTNSNIKQAATAKIQMEIEEQTQREMALRETGHIQTISQERTDSKVAKLKTAENVPQTNGNSPSPVNGNGYTNGFNGRSSPDSGVPYKRSSPSPTNARPASIFAQNGKSNISMHKFISSKGKETTFSAPRNGPFQPPKEENISRSAVPPPMVKLKRNVSVESKIQQEILEMKQREEELKKMHMHMMSNGNSVSDENETEHEMNQNNLEYENGNGVCEEEISPRHNKLIAQWEQRIQKAES